jgi:hypothetical protein
MTKLQSEQHRLYVLAGTEAEGFTRTMVLALARPADWSALSKVWQGVQADLELPAPAIAVSGTDGFQLWFSLLEPWPIAQALAFLESLRGRYLPGVSVERVGLTTAAPQVPALQAQTGNWSAFVAPDLAPVFTETPWLDIPPNLDGQADLLSRLDSIKRADFQRALERLSPAPAEAAAPRPRVVGLVKTESPRHFLLEVMNHDAIELSLRIEAAKALLLSAQPT